MSLLSSRLYLLSAQKDRAAKLGSLLSTHGFEVETLSEKAEFLELLGALPADIVVIDEDFSAEIAEITAGIGPIRGNANQPLSVVMIGHTNGDEVASKISAKRAGIDLFVSAQLELETIALKIRAQFSSGQDAPYRVLIAEDDRSQAMFAESVLRGAGMETQIELEALNVLPALSKFKPDLILMDLHMPSATGTELTSLIRESEEFVHIPIVFLSGEVDPDAQFEALDAGGDDFHSKPIRPKHLIASVKSRIRRYRARGIAQRAAPPSEGLLTRAIFIDQLDGIVQSADERRHGALFFLDLENVASLREKLALSAFERAHVAIQEALLALKPNMSLCRFADGGFLVLMRDCPKDRAIEEGRELRQAISARPISIDGQSINLLCSVGVCDLRHKLENSGSLLNMVERLAREARRDKERIKEFVPLDAIELARQEALVEDMRNAMGEGRLSLLFQPIVAVAGGDASQYQTLVRMDSEISGRLTAAEIVPAAERSGFIVEVDRWVLTESMAHIRQAKDQGQQMRLFITQSPKTLAQRDQADWLSAQLERHQIDGSSLVLEIRFDDAAMHIGTLKGFCAQMLPSGVEFCLAQCSAGPDLDSLIGQLPLKMIKLSQRYSASEMDSNQASEVRQMIDQAHARDLQVIGPGVENAQSAATLWMSGIDFIQGNLVQRADTKLNFDFHQAIL